VKTLLLISLVIFCLAPNEQSLGQQKIAIELAQESKRLNRDNSGGFEKQITIELLSEFKRINPSQRNWSTRIAEIRLSGLATGSVRIQNHDGTFVTIIDKYRMTYESNGEALGYDSLDYDGLGKLRPIRIPLVTIEDQKKNRWKQLFYITLNDVGGKFASFKNSPIIIFEKCKIDSINCEGARIVNNYSTNFAPQMIYIESDTLEIAYLREVEKLTIKNSIIKSLDCKPKIISFCNSSFVCERNLNSFASNASRVTLRINFADISKLTFDYQLFKYDTTYSKIKPSEAIVIFNQIKDMQKRLFYDQGYELVDKELREYQFLTSPPFLGIKTGAIKNFFAKNWWDYGYDKGNVFVITFWSILVSLALNLLCYDRLLRTYQLSAFVDAQKNLTEYTQHQWTRPVKYFFYCLMFTITVFLKIKLEVDKLSLKNSLLVILIGLEYLTGIFCLAYIANYVLAR
jgi:hypothetical protein